MPGCVITLPKMVSERLDLSFGIFARRGEKYSCYHFCFLQTVASALPSTYCRLNQTIIRDVCFVGEAHATDLLRGVGSDGFLGFGVV